MNKITKKIVITGAAFAKGYIHEMKNPYSIGAATALGIYQGLKYNGNLVRGIKTGGVVLMICGTIGGISTILGNWDVIKNA